MSDFTSPGWSFYVGGVTVLGLILCLVLLAIASKRQVMASDNSTGHVWDEDLRELNNPLPRWWMGLFVITVAFAAIYLTLYPGLGTRKGTLDWTSHGQYAAEVERARAQMAPVYAKYVSMPAQELIKDPAAMAIGERLFANTCAGCHGSDARGSKGFPNLTEPAASRLATDTPESIEATITNGRTGMMPPMAAALGSPQDVKNVANYVLSLSGSPHNNVAAELGKAKFGVCAACHGADGKGNKTIGAPNLTDNYWLWGWGEDAIVYQITNGRTNVMPAHKDRLSPEQIHVLAAYVYSLEGKAGTAAQ
ncbi:MAG: cytochrome-c oxidase, cbb3-type subunit III [Burkholderiales bacterium]|nr:cytochrome-c oxidase, cbb3-type subunit III [Burkholderiales bacterium]